MLMQWDCLYPLIFPEAIGGCRLYKASSLTDDEPLFERGALLPVSLSPNFESTEKKEAEMIFGGMEALTDKIKENQELYMLECQRLKSILLGIDFNLEENYDREKGPCGIYRGSREVPCQGIPLHIQGKFIDRIAKGS